MREKEAVAAVSSERKNADRLQTHYRQKREESYTKKDEDVSTVRPIPITEQLASRPRCELFCRTNPSFFLPFAPYDVPFLPAATLPTLSRASAGFQFCWGTGTVHCVFDRLVHISATAGYRLLQHRSFVAKSSRYAISHLSDQTKRQVVVVMVHCTGGGKENNAVNLCPHLRCLSRFALPSYSLSALASLDDGNPLRRRALPVLCRSLSLPAVLLFVRIAGIWRGVSDTGC